MRRARRRSYAYGVWAEYLAAFYLWLKLYKIVALRYKTPVGEIDIVARKGNVLVIVEVKARADIADALASINARGRKRIEDAARHFMAHHCGSEDMDVRFDVIAIGLCKAWPICLRHLDNAWRSRA